MSIGRALLRQNESLKREGARFWFVMCDWCGHNIPNYKATLVHQGQWSLTIIPEGTYYNDGSIHICFNCKEKGVKFSRLWFVMDNLLGKRDSVGRIWHCGLRKPQEQKERR